MTVSFQDSSASSLLIDASRDRPDESARSLAMFGQEISTALISHAIDQFSAVAVNSYSQGFDRLIAELFEKIAFVNTAPLGVSRKQEVEYPVQVHMEPKARGTVEVRLFSLGRGKPRIVIYEDQED